MDALNRIRSGVWLGVIAIVGMPSTGDAHPFVGPAPLPADDAVWIVIESVSRGRGLEPAARLGIQLLGLKPGRNLFRLDVDDAASIERSFGDSGEVCRALVDVKPATVVVMLDGGGTKSGRPLPEPAWIGRRLLDVRRCASSSLIVAVAEVASVKAKDELVAASGSRAAPLSLLLAVGNGVPSDSFPVAELMRWADSVAPPPPGTKEISDKLFTAQDEKIGALQGLFLFGLLGRADDLGDDGYDVSELTAWLFDTHRKVAAAARPRRTSELMPLAYWSRHDSSAALRFPLKRHHYSLAICTAAAGGPVATDPARKHLTELAGHFAEAAQALVRSWRRDPSALRVDTAPLGNGTSPVMPRDCARSPRRAEFDAWANVFDTGDGHYILHLTRGQTEELVLGPSSSPPDLAQAKALLAQAARTLLRPPPVHDPIPVAARVTAQAAETAGLIFLIDRSNSNRELVETETGRKIPGSDPEGTNRRTAFERIVRAVSATAEMRHATLPVAAAVTFGDSATTLELDGSYWLDTSAGAIGRAADALGADLHDDEQTNIGDAIDIAGRLMSERPAVRQWHVILMTDGVPTVGVTAEAELLRKARAAFGDRAVLSALTLSCAGGNYADRRALERLVQTIGDGAGQHGELAAINANDPPGAWMPRVDRIASLITGSMVLREAALLCESAADGAIQCQLKNQSGAAFSLGAVREVGFQIEYAALGAGRCVVTLRNDGLPGQSVRVELRSHEPTTVARAGDVEIRMIRSENRLFLRMASLHQVLNGSWGVSLEIHSALEASR